MPILNHNLKQCTEKCDCGHYLYLRCQRDTETLESFDYVKHCNFCGKLYELSDSELNELGLVKINTQK